MPNIISHSLAEGFLLLSSLAIIYQLTLNIRVWVLECSVRIQLLTGYKTCSCPSSLRYWQTLVRNILANRIPGARISHLGRWIYIKGSNDIYTSRFSRLPCLLSENQEAWMQACAVKPPPSSEGLYIKKSISIITTACDLICSLQSLCCLSVSGAGA